MAETQCRYLCAGRYHQRLKILTQLKKLNKRELTLEHLITRAENGRHMVVGIEKRICIDAGNPMELKVASIPDMVYRTLIEALGDNSRMDVPGNPE